MQLLSVLTTLTHHITEVSSFSVCKICNLLLANATRGYFYVQRLQRRHLSRKV
jgi:hypothetical protein